MLSISDAQLWSLPEGTEKKRSFSDPNSALKLPKRTATEDQVNRSKEEVDSEEICGGCFDEKEE